MCVCVCLHIHTCILLLYPGKLEAESFRKTLIQFEANYPSSTLPSRSVCGEDRSDRQLLSPWWTSAAACPQSWEPNSRRPCQPLPQPTGGGGHLCWGCCFSLRKLGCCGTKLVLCIFFPFSLKLNWKPCSRRSSEGRCLVSKVNIFQILHLAVQLNLRITKTMSSTMVRHQLITQVCNFRFNWN